MNYSDILARVSGKRPFWLYRIKRGSQISLLTSRPGGWVLEADYFDNQDYFNASIDDYFAPVSPYGLNWEAAPITHSKINQTTRLKAAEVDLTLPNSHPVARQFLDMDGLTENSVVIWHGFDGADDLAVKFRGRVVSRKASRTKITLICENNFTALRSKGLSAVIQRPCRHAVYHGGCGLVLADWQEPGTVSAATGLVLTIAEAAGKPDGFFRGGIITFDGAVQMITKHVGDTLTLLGPLPGLVEDVTSNGTSAVQIAPGCDRSTDVCDTRFDNIKNHGGFPWMSGNPFDGRSVY